MWFTTLHGFSNSCLFHACPTEFRRQFRFVASDQSRQSQIQPNPFNSQTMPLPPGVKYSIPYIVSWRGVPPNLDSIGIWYSPFRISGDNTSGILACQSWMARIGLRAFNRVAWLVAFRVSFTMLALSRSMACAGKAGVAMALFAQPPSTAGPSTAPRQLPFDKVPPGAILTSSLVPWTGPAWL